MKDKLIPAVKISQGERDILLFGLSAKFLREICYFNSNNSPCLDIGRSREIAKYITSEEDAVLADSVIVNIELEKFNLTLEDVFHDNQLDLKKIIEAESKIKPAHPALKGKIAFVIEGQEKLKAFESIDKDIPLVVTATVNLSLAEVVELFIKSNPRRTLITMVFDGLGITKEVFPQYFRLFKITERLNKDIESPFYDSIGVAGFGMERGFISQAAIITSIEKSGIEDTIRKLGLSRNNRDVLYDVIWNFFKAVQKEYRNDWTRGGSLTKSSAIRTLFLIMNNALTDIISNNREFSVEEIRKYLRKINKEHFPCLFQAGNQ